jgi:hypothetical protein
MQVLKDGHQVMVEGLPWFSLVVDGDVDPIIVHEVVCYFSLHAHSSCITSCIINKVCPIVDQGLCMQY